MSSSGANCSKKDRIPNLPLNAALVCYIMRTRMAESTLPAAVLLLLAIATISHGLECFCTGDSQCVNNTCEVTGDYSVCETHVEFNNHTGQLITFWAKCIENPYPFSFHWSVCFGDTGQIWKDPSNYPTSLSNTYCCTSGDYCNECPLDLLTIPGVTSFLPSHCKLPSAEPSTVVDVMETEALAPTDNSTVGGHFEIVTLTLTGCIVLSGAVMWVLICSLYFKWRSRKGHENFKKDSQCMMEHEPFTVSVDYSISSSGMNGARLLQQRTLGDDIKKIRRLGRGSFGDVWLGDWLGEEVAVKVFHTRAEESWRREEEIYRTHMLTHDNILKFKTAEQRTYLNSDIELWTIFEYHHNGTLYEYLEETPLDMCGALKLCVSFISGLHYLHKDIQVATCHAKPGIAHRDLKSRNILVKADGTCTIADLGLAVKHNGVGGIDKIPSNKLQGTRRCMPPEILDQTMDFTSFQCYKWADIYSASLILYEIVSCVKFNGMINQHTLPYNNHLPSDPTLEEVKNVVCTGIRPDLGFLGNEQSLSSSFTILLQEGWHQDPAVRPTASYMNKRVSSMQK